MGKSISHHILVKVFHGISGTKPNVIVVQKTQPRRSITGSTPGKTTAVISSPFEKVNEPRHEKTGLLLCENKDADQLRGNREADHHLCFRYLDSTISLLTKSEISKL